MENIKDESSKSNVIKQKQWFHSKNVNKKSRKNRKTTTAESKNQSTLDNFLKNGNRKAYKRKIEATPSKSSLKSLPCVSPSSRFEALVPKVEDILRRREEYKKNQEIQELIEKSSTQFLKSLKDKKVKESQLPKRRHCKKILDCKHLTLAYLERKFQKDIEYIDNIFHGVIYSERNELFKNDTPLNDFTEKDLRFNESTSVFTEEQLIHIVTMFRDKYDDGNRYKYSDYYYKVLLPEYCLKIFMDQYKMRKEIALNYLKSIPVSPV